MSTLDSHNHPQLGNAIIQAVRQELAKREEKTTLLRIAKVLDWENGVSRTSRMTMEGCTLKVATRILRHLRDTDFLGLTLDIRVGEAGETFELTSDDGEVAISGTLFGEPLPSERARRKAAKAAEAAETAETAEAADDADEADDDADDDADEADDAA